MSSSLIGHCPGMKKRKIKNEPCILTSYRICFISFRRGSFRTTAHSLVSGDLLIVPHWVLIYLIFIAIFYDVKNTSYSVIYAVVFGLLIDSVYVGVLGVYMFSYGISVYIIKRMTRFLQENVFTAMLLGVVGMIIAEF